MQKVVWDMDPGIDDALALILALESPEVRVLGITTVAGNAPVEMTSANARRVLEYLDAGSIPVAVGGAKPMRKAMPITRNSDLRLGSSAPRALPIGRFPISTPSRKRTIRPITIAAPAMDWRKR